MDVTPVPPAPVKVPVAGSSAAVQRKGKSSDDMAEGSTSASDFSRLLQEVELPEEGTDTGPELISGAPEVIAEENVLPADFLLKMSVQAAEEVVTDLPAQAAWAADPAWSVQSLVGQTAQLGQAAQLDQVADAVVRDGVQLQARRDAVLGAANTAALAAAEVPVAAQGVVGTGAAAMAGLTPAGVAKDLAVVPDAQALAPDAVAETLTADASEAVVDTVQRGERSSEGRMALQGQWTAADLQAKPAEIMQRLLGQMSQFLVSQGGEGLGGLRRAVGKTDEGSTVTGAETAAVYGGSGTGRLTENAVSQAAASQQMQNSEPQAEPDMAFWMNARQQRAEMVLDRDGEPVRVQVTMHGNEAHVTFLSDAPGTRSMLDASMAQLRDMLAAQGVELSGAQVRTQADGEAQSDGSGREDRFMPEGARRMRVQAAAIPGLDAGMLTGAGRAPHQGLDVFA